MKAMVYSPTGRLGKVRLQRELGAFIEAEQLRIGTSHGAAVIRTPSPAPAWVTRTDWRSLSRIVDLFGYPLRVETSRREAEALMAGGYVPTNGGSYRLVIKDRRVVVEAGR